MRVVLCVALLMLSGCTISVVDTRITREEIAQAFAQRDENIQAIAQALAAMKKGEQ